MELVELEVQRFKGMYMRDQSKPYLWNKIHWPTPEMESCVSFNDESFAFRLSSVKAMLSDHSLQLSNSRWREQSHTQPSPHN